MLPAKKLLVVVDPGAPAHARSAVAPALRSLSAACQRAVQDGRCDLHVALVGEGFREKQDTWIATSDVPGAIDAYLAGAAGLPVEADTLTANPLWRLLDQCGSAPSGAGAAELQCVLDVVYLADYESFARDRWKRNIDPLLLASENLGARVCTVVAARDTLACAQFRQVAYDWCQGLNGELVELASEDFEVQQTHPHSDCGMVLAARAESRVFCLPTRWRGHVLISARNATGALTHKTCSVELDALTACGHKGAADGLPANSAPHADTAAGGTALGKSARKSAAAAVSAHAEPLVHGVHGHSSYLRVWRIVDGASIPVHLLAAGCCHLRIIRGETAALEGLMRHPRAAVIGCLETWKDTERRPVDDLLDESADQREARRKRLLHQAFCQHDATSTSASAGAAGYDAGYEMVSRRLVVLQRDAGGSERLLVSAFRCGNSAGLVQSFAPFLRSFFFSSPREAGASTPVSAQTIPDAGERKSSVASDIGPENREVGREDIEDVDQVGTVHKKRPLWDWSSEIPRRRKRARTLCAVAQSGSHREGAEGKQASEGMTCAKTLRDCLYAMTDAEIERLKADDKVRSGDGEDMTHKELPRPDISTRRRSRKDKDKVRAPAGQGAKDDSFKAKMKEFVAKVRARLLADERAAKEGTSALASPGGDEYALQMGKDQGCGLDRHIEPQDMQCDEGAVQQASAALEACAATEEVKEWGAQILSALEQCVPSTEEVRRAARATAASADDTPAFFGFELCPVELKHGSFCGDARTLVLASPRKHSSKDDRPRPRAPRPAVARGDAESKGGRAVGKPLHVSNVTPASSVTRGPNGHCDQRQVYAKGQERAGMPELKRNGGPLLGAQGKEAARSSSLVKEARQQEVRQRDAAQGGRGMSNGAAGGTDKGPGCKAKIGAAASTEIDPRLKKVLKSVLKTEMKKEFGDVGVLLDSNAWEQMRAFVYKMMVQWASQMFTDADLSKIDDQKLREILTKSISDTCKTRKSLML